MGKSAPTSNLKLLAEFDDHAVSIAKRQYFQPGDDDLAGMFERVASWVAKPESELDRETYKRSFFDLMASKRFCPGGRVLAGAATSHGNVLNCFVQDGRPQQEGTTAWVLHLATKLALVTKVGGGNGLCLDPLPAKRPFRGQVGQLYLTIAGAHPDHQKVRDGTFMDLVHGKYATRGYRYLSFVEYDAVPAGVQVTQVGDSVDQIWGQAGKATEQLLAGKDVLLDLSALRAEGTPVNGSGGTSSGPSSFAVEVFDNFAFWASLGGAEYAGPVATLRYIFAPTLRAIRQGGCLHPDTLVHTSRGTLRLTELVDARHYGWQDHHLKVATDEGWKDSPRGFNNGNAATLKVTLTNGQEVQGTPQHRLKVMRSNGAREWVRLDELQSGDHVIQMLDQHTGAPVMLSPVPIPHHNAHEIKQPEVLSEELAFFLGYLWGDGFVSSGRVGFAVAHDSPMVEKTHRLFKELFGLSVSLEQKENDASAVFVVKGAHLIAWLQGNGLLKGRARHIRVPRAVRMAPRPVLGAFLRGIFEADGTLIHGYPTLSTASGGLAQDVAVLLAGLGIPTTQRGVKPRPDRYSRHAIHHVGVRSAKGLERFVERVGVLPGSRLEKMREFRPDTSRESSWVLPHAPALLEPVLSSLPKGVKGWPSPYTFARKSLSRYIQGGRNLTATGYETLRRNESVARLLPEFQYDEYYVQVSSVEEAGRSLTLDISVDENKTYLANGVVSHNTRRGAGMATMSITHPDIHDFITAKDLERERLEGDISTFNISILVSDEFMKRSRTEEEKGVLHGIAEHAWQTGEPGLIYIDRINQYNPMRASLGEIKATNPCFPADVRIATQRGLLTLGELFESQEELIVASDRRVPEDGLGVTPRAAVPVFKTSDAEPVYRVVTKHGYEVRATANHQFLTPSGWTELCQLKHGDTLYIQSAEGMWSDQYEFDIGVVESQSELVATAGSNNRGGSLSRTGRSDIRERFAGVPARWSGELGTFLGFMVGDGFISATKAGISFANDDYDELSEYIEQYHAWFNGGVQRHHSSIQVRFGRVVIGYLEALGLQSLKAVEKRVPESIFRAPREAVVGFLRALFTADGTVNLSGYKKSCSIRLASSSRKLLGDVQLLLSNFGIVSRIHLRREAGEKAMPDGRGGSQIYPFAAQYELILDKANRDIFAQKIGFLTKAKQSKVLEFIASKSRQSNQERFEAEVVDVVFDGVEAVYDTTEPVAHSIVANGLVVHQCGEIPLFPGEPCDLGAINLAAYVKRGGMGMDGFDIGSFRNDVRTCIRFLDNVLDVNHFALEDNRTMSHQLRRLGLGIMGLADALILMGHRYDSDEGRAAVKRMIDELREASTKASEELAEERGVFPGFPQSDLARARRNIALLTVAPTGTTSMLMGVSSGVEPIFAPFIYRKIGDTYAALIAPLFKELLERHEPHLDYRQGQGWDWEKVVEAVQANHGSVQGLDFIPDDVRTVLICAHDIAPTDHVQMQGVVQRSFDGGEQRVANSISKTINLPNQAGVQDVYDAYRQAFDAGCKGITVYRDGSRDFQVLSTSSKPEAKVEGEPQGTEGSKVGVKEQHHVEGKEEGRVEGSHVAQALRAVPTASPAAEPGPSAPASRDVPEPAPRLPGEPLFDRPVRVSGFTDKVKLTLPGGEKRGFYVTVNKQDGLPTEVFIVSGKAGDESNADSEALGRMVSIALQYGVPAEAIVHTLRGINGGMYGSYQGRMVASKADLIAVALETAGVQNTLNKGKGCPDCSAPLRFEEGCAKCESCGYSKCS
ncbi:MAG: LAGLIDADG family homing endonuclease [Trueperaceae bacterium]